MEASVERMLDTFGELREKANVKACFGEPVTVEGRTVIPVAKVGYGFGMGAGQGPSATINEGGPEMEVKEGGSGGGGGIASSPLAVVEVTAQGARVEPIIDEERVVIASLLVAAWGVFWLARALMAIFRPKE